MKWPAIPRSRMMIPAVMPPNLSKNCSLMSFSPLRASQVARSMDATAVTAKTVLTAIRATVPSLAALKARGSRATHGVSPKMTTRPHAALLLR